MKLHNLVLTAALFLTAGIASAAVVHENGNYIWNKDNMVNNDNQVAVTLTHDGAKGWHYYLYSLDNPGWIKELEEGTHQVTLASGTQYGVKAYKSNGGGNSGEKICFSGQNAGIGSGDFHFIGNASANEIVFGKNGTAKGTVSFGSPLPAPVVTLLIALGFGAALVMYRNRKQVKA